MWEIIEGEIPILLVAAHNYPHEREGRIKARDVATGYLVKELCEKTKCWGIISSAVQKDPNWYSDSPFRVEVKKIVKNFKISAVIDIHGRREDYPELIEYYPNELFLHKWQLSKGLIKPSPIPGQFTLTKDLGTIGIPCVAVEIRKDGRVTISGKEENYGKPRDILIDLIQEIEPGVGVEPTT